MILSGCNKKVSKVSLVSQFDPVIGINVLEILFLYLFNYYYFCFKTQSRKDAYSNEGLRLQNAPMQKKKTHIPIHTGTHTNTDKHTHGTHTPIYIHYNINNVSAGI